ncbi:hypothetical protein L9F63_023191, partial [Diploptera punctata]
MEVTKFLFNLPLFVIFLPIVVMHWSNLIVDSSQYAKRRPHYGNLWASSRLFIECVFFSTFIPYLKFDCWYVLHMLSFILLLYGR